MEAVLHHTSSERTGTSSKIHISIHPASVIKVKNKKYGTSSFKPQVHVKGLYICKMEPLVGHGTFKIFKRRGSAIPTDPAHFNHWRSFNSGHFDRKFNVVCDTCILECTTVF